MKAKILTARKGTIWGAAIGAFLSASVVHTSMIIAPFLMATAFCNIDSRGHRSGIFVLWIIMFVWILFKSFSENGIGEYLLVELFLISILAAFSLLTYRKYILTGLIISLTPIVLLDVVSNLMQLMLGSDIFGNSPNTLRSDGLRLTGVFGHSFVSLGLYFSYFMLLLAAGFRWSIVIVPIILLLIVGSFRGYVFLPLLVIYSVLFYLSWRSVFLVSLIIPIAIAALAIMSVQSGLLSESSGNTFRIIAWSNALTEISHHPVLGSTAIPINLPEDFEVNEENIIYYQVYESVLLQDAVRYGLPFVFIKLLFFYKIGKLHYQVNPSRTGALTIAKSFVVAFIITDYAIFSFLNMPFTALIAASILASSDTRPVSRVIPV